MANLSTVSVINLFRELSKELYKEAEELRNQPSNLDKSRAQGLVQASNKIDKLIKDIRNNKVY